MVLARLFVLIAITGVITPSFYAYAVEAAPEATTSQAAHTRMACVKVRTSISNRTAHFQQMGERHLDVIDTVYTYATAYAKNNSIAVSDADKAAVESARIAAKSAIISMASAEDTLNCEDANAEHGASNLRTNIHNTSEQLHAYRQAVRNVLQTMQGLSL